ncbi:nuclear transport factor 2 family protein [Candidatus Pacearchaeota archaeon]|nr:nuclear transport factor 2 family protein [Candidatus Pacearchaeota archaeon]
MKEEIIKKYFENLSNGDYESLIQLFDSEAVVFSPLYGKMLAKDFYKKLLEDSDGKSNVELIKSFVDKDALKGAGNFRYNWTLKDGTQSSFEGVDLFEFNENGKIKQIKIIYDTFGTRENFNKIKENKE